MVSRATYRGIFPPLKRALRLRGPLAGNPTARILHALLIGLLAWSGLEAVLFIPFLVARPVAAAIFLAAEVIVYAVALLLLNRGAGRSASYTYLIGIWLAATVLSILNGGIRSPALVLFTPIPISAAWLLGYRAALVTSAACLVSCLVMTAADVLGVPMPRFFPGSPFGIWSIFLQAIVIAAVPVMLVLRILNESLAATKLWIGELRVSENKLRRERDLVNRIMETSPVGIVATDAEGRITFANSAAETIFGCGRESITSRTYNDETWNITHHDGRPCADEELAFRRVQSSGQSVHGLRLAIARPDGRRVLLSVNAAPVFANGDKFDGMVVALEDVTERVRTEEELRKHREHLEELVRVQTAELTVARDEAMAANRAKSVFLANMSHELRTPLSAILGFSAMMRGDPGLSAQHRTDIDTISRSGEHLLALINDVVDIARIEAGPRELEISACSVEALVRDVCEMIRQRAGAKGLELRVVESPGFPRWVQTDGQKLRQILINLLANAVQYTDRGSITLRLDAEGGEAPGRMRLKFEVEDTGIGIATDDQQRIFEPFVQIAGPERPKGTGLGLAITRQFVTLLNGSIAVESTPGKGSLFRVMLPAAATKPFEAAGPRPDVVAGLAPGQPEWRVLVIEDESDNRLLLERLLRTAGFCVRTAADGAQGLAMFQDWRPHFIWMDLRIPVVDGLETARRIRNLEGGQVVKIAAVSASSTGNAREDVLAAGMDDFVRKPYRAFEIFDCMARHLGVRYRFVSAASGLPDEAGVTVPLEAIASLPEASRAELRKAVLALDPVRITSVIQEVAGNNGALAAALSECAKRLAYTAILDAIDAADRVTAKAGA